MANECCNNACNQGRECPNRPHMTILDRPVRFAVVLYSAALFILFGLAACDFIPPCDNTRCGGVVLNYGNGPDVSSAPAAEAAPSAPAEAPAPSAPSEGKGHGGKGGHHGKGDHDDGDDDGDDD